MDRFYQGSQSSLLLETRAEPNPSLQLGFSFWSVQGMAQCSRSGQEHSWQRSELPQPCPVLGPSPGTPEGFSSQFDPSLSDQALPKAHPDPTAPPQCCPIKLRAPKPFPGVGGSLSHFPFTHWAKPVCASAGICSSLDANP